MPYDPRDGRLLSRWMMMRDASVCAVDGLQMGDGCVMAGEGVRPQGGGGVDHPNEVQQKRTQIHMRFSPTPGAIGTLFSNMSNYNFV